MQSILRTFTTHAKRRTGRAAFLAWAPALSLAAALLMPALVKAQATAPSVTTAHNDNFRTGANLNENAFTTGFLSNLSPAQFGRIWTRPLDGSVYAQPLYLPKVQVPGAPDLITNSAAGGGGFFNIVLVCTTHNSVYAFDAGGSVQNSHPGVTTGASASLVRTLPFWKTNFNFPNAGIVPATQDEVQSDDLGPEFGIIGTPVIDAHTDPMTGVTTGTLYVVAKTREGLNGFAQRLHALDIQTGLERMDPVVINASVPGMGDGAIFDFGFNPVVPFDPLLENQQAALTLVNAGTPKATIYVAWGAHSNVIPYHGWVMAFKASDLSLTGVFNTSPNGDSSTIANGAYPAGAGIWMSGAGPAVDSNGFLYVVTGAGDFNADPNVFDPTMFSNTEYGNSVLQLQIAAVGSSSRVGLRTQQRKPHDAGGGTVTDYFTPFDWQTLSQTGSDLGSGGIVLIPNPVNSPPLNSTYPNLGVVAGENGTIYLLSLDNLGGFAQDTSLTPSGDLVVQSLPHAIGPVYGVPAYLSSNNTLYFQATGEGMKAFQFQQGLLVGPIAQSRNTYAFPGATPVISAMSDGTNGIVWTVERHSTAATNTPISVLRAYDANDISQELYNSLQSGARDFAGANVLYAVPTVANGRVYVGGVNQLTTFGFFTTNGVTSPGTEADHFIVMGANNSHTRNTNYYSVTAIGPDGRPIALSSTVHLNIRNRFTNALQTIGNLSFKTPQGPSSNVVFNYPFLLTGSYDFYVTDNDGHTSSGTSVTVNSGLQQSSGVDHLRILTAATQAKTGGKGPSISVTAVTASNSPVAVPLVQVVNPNGGFLYVPPSFSVTVTNPDGSSYQLPNVTFTRIFSGNPSPVSLINFNVPLQGLGNHVIIIQGFVNGTAVTGTATIKGI